MKEKLSKSPSKFTLIINGEERVINIGEAIPLDPGGSAGTEAMDKFEVEAHADYLILKIHYGSERFLRSNWGLIKKDHFNSDKSFGTTFTSAAFSKNDQRGNLMGSSMYFNEEFTKLTGNGWVIEYRVHP